MQHFKEANKIKKNAYCPYSNFHVGCILEMKDGQLIEGVNVENTAYGSTICAERNAMLHSITKGYKKGDIKSITITSDSTDPTYPCGDCRQVMLELCYSYTPIYMIDKTGKKIINCTVEQLIPTFVTKKEK